MLIKSSNKNFSSLFLFFLFFLSFNSLSARSTTSCISLIESQLFGGSSIWSNIRKFVQQRTKKINNEYNISQLSPLPLYKIVNYNYGLVPSKNKYHSLLWKLFFSNPHHLTWLDCTKLLFPNSPNESHKEKYFCINKHGWIICPFTHSFYSSVSLQHSWWVKWLLRIIRIIHFFCLL